MCRVDNGGSMVNVETLVDDGNEVCSNAVYIVCLQDGNGFELANGGHVNIVKAHFRYKRERKSKSIQREESD